MTGEPEFRLGRTLVIPSRLRLRGPGGERTVEKLIMRCLVALHRRRGEVVSREELVAHCWGDRIVGEDSLHQMISKLRRVVDEVNGGFVVETIRGVGYRLTITQETQPLRARAFVSLAVLLVTIFVGAFTLGTRSDAEEKQPSLAVLPFRDLGPHPARDHFAEGISGEILTLLSQQHGFRTVGGASASKLGPSADHEDVRDRLGVSHMLEGSLARSGGKVRISARLTRTSDGTQIWAQSFDREAGELFELQDELGAAVVAQLIEAVSQRRMRPSPRTSLAVYDLYLNSNIVARQRTHSAMLQAKHMVEKAIELDPGYAPAYARLAIYRLIIDQRRPSGSYQDDSRRLAKTRVLIERALALNPQLADAHSAMGMLVWHTDPRAALEHHQRALALDPGNFLAWNNGGNSLARMCRYSEAISWYRRAAATEPLLWVPYSNWSGNLVAIGRRGAATSVMKRYYALTKDRRGYHFMRARAALEESNPSAAALHARAALLAGATDAPNRMVLARSLEVMGMGGAALDALPEHDRVTVGSYWRGDTDHATRAEAFSGGTPRAAHEEAVARSLLTAAQPARLVQQFDARFGSVERYVRENDCDLYNRAGPLITALRTQGRAAEAAKLVSIAKRNLAALKARAGSSPALAVALAELHMVDGAHAPALQQLEQAVRQGWSGSTHSLLSLSDRVFDPLRRTRRFAEIEKVAAQNRLRERRQYEAQISSERLDYI